MAVKNPLYANMNTVGPSAVQSKVLPSVAPWNSADQFIGSAYSPMGGNLGGSTWAANPMGTSAAGNYTNFQGDPFRASLSPVGMGANAASTKINSRPTVGETGDDAIARQGGLSPQYNMGGLNSFYQQQYAPSAFDRLQNQRSLQQLGPAGFNASQYIGNMQRAAGANDPSSYAAWQQAMEQWRAYQQSQQAMQQPQTPAASPIGFMPSFGGGQIPYMMPQIPAPQRQEALGMGYPTSTWGRHSWSTTPQDVARGRDAVYQRQRGL